MVNKLLARGFPFGPSMRIRLLGGVHGLPCEPFKAHSGIDVIAQHRLADLQFAREKLFHRFGKKCFTKGRIAISARFHCLLERGCQCHFI